MPPISKGRPGPGDYGDFYAGYVDLVPDGDVLEHLSDQARALQMLLRGMSNDWGTHRYAPAKWSIKEVVGHLIDSERVFASRALRFARGDETELPGFDQDAYVAAGRFEERSLTGLLEEYAAVRQATMSLLSNLREDELERSGVANGFRVTVRALAWIIAGHERHHTRSLREKYLGASAAE